MRVLTEKDYKVMSKILNSKEKIGMSKVTGVTRNQLRELTSLSYTKVGDALKALIEYGFVELGIAKGREKTYYLTSKGMEELRNIAMCSVKIESEGK